MTPQVLIALIGAIATVAVAAIGYFSHKVTKGLDAVDARLDRVEAKMDRLETKIDRWTEIFDARIAALSDDHTHMRERLAPVETVSQPLIWKPAGTGDLPIG